MNSGNLEQNHNLEGTKSALESAHKHSSYVEVNEVRVHIRSFHAHAIRADFFVLLESYIKWCCTCHYFIYFVKIHVAT